MVWCNGWFLADKDSLEGWRSVFACSLVAAESDSWCTDPLALLTGEGLGWGWLGGCLLFLPPGFSFAASCLSASNFTTGFSHWWMPGSRKEHHRADLQSKNPLWEISPAPARPLPCLHRLQEGFQQGLAYSFLGNHEEVQHQHPNLTWVIKTSMTRPLVQSTSTAA